MRSERMGNTTKTIDRLLSEIDQVLDDCAARGIDVVATLRRAVEEHDRRNQVGSSDEV